MAFKKEFNPETIKVQFDRVIVGDFFYCDADAFLKGKHIRTAEGFIYPKTKTGLMKKLFGKGKQEEIDTVKITVRIEWANGKTTIEHPANKK